MSEPLKRKIKTKLEKKMCAKEKVINKMIYDNNIMSLIPRFGESAS